MTKEELMALCQNPLATPAQREQAQRLLDGMTAPAPEAAAAPKPAVDIEALLAAMKAEFNAELTNRPAAPAVNPRPDTSGVQALESLATLRSFYGGTTEVGKE